MDDNQRDVIFVDAYNLIYRAFHGNKATLTNSEGMPTNAIYTCAAMLQGIPQQFNNLAYALAVFDGGGNFRSELDANYKANRKPMPDELKVQMPHIKELFEILGWPMHQAQDVEADDVIGTLSKRAASKGFNTYILSGDKDFRQLVCDNLHVIDMKSKIVYDERTIKEKMDILPSQVVQYLALLGDSADNVCGIDKVGDKTAAKYLNQYGNMAGIEKNQHELSGKAGENMRAAFADGTIAKNIELITLKTDLDINLTAKELRMRPVDQERWLDFCEKMNFKSFSNHSARSARKM